MKGIQYASCPLRIQYDYCKRILLTCYVPYLDLGEAIVGTWELNNSNLVHFHFLIASKKILGEYWLKDLQHYIRNCPEVALNRKNKDAKDYMNNIVFVNKPVEEIIAYMDKDQIHKCKLPYGGNYIFENGLI